MKGGRGGGSRLFQKQRCFTEAIYMSVSILPCSLGDFGKTSMKEDDIFNFKMPFRQFSFALNMTF